MALSNKQAFIIGGLLGFLVWGLKLAFFRFDEFLPLDVLLWPYTAVISFLPGNLLTVFLFIILPTTPIIFYGIIGIIVNKIAEAMG